LLKSDSYFAGIDDLPVFNWYMVHNTADVSYLLTQRKEIGLLGRFYLSDIWRRIYDEYIARFGFGEKFMELMDKKRNVALMRIDRALTGDKSKNTFINIAEIELKNMMEESGRVSDLHETAAMIGKNLGFYIDVKKCSVVEFYSFIKAIEKINKPKINISEED